MSAFVQRFRNGDIFPWERDFTREALNVAVPIVIQTLFMALMHILDNVMIGRLGEVELAAVTQANRVTFLFQLVIFGLASGTSTLVAQYWGKQDLQGIHAVMGLALCISLGAAVCFLIPCMLFPRTLRRLLLEEEAAVTAGAQYLPIIGIGYLFTAVSQCLVTVQKSTEQARLPMVAGITALFVNTFLNYCLIFGNLGFPRMGVRGGAVATVVALFVEMSIVFLAGRFLHLATDARLSSLIPRSGAFVKKYLSVAFPVILNEGFWSLGMVMYSVVYGHMSTGAVAAMSIFNTVEQVSYATQRGVTHACAVLVGKRIGAGREEEARRTSRRMLAAGVPSALLAGALLIALSGPLISLFNVSAQAAADARSLVAVSALTMLLSQFASLLVVGVLRAGGDVKYSLVLDVGTVWAIGVPLVALSGLVLGWPIHMVYLMSRLESVVKVLFGFWRLRSGKWIHNLVR